MPSNAAHSHIMHAHGMGANTMHSTFSEWINSDMPTVAIGLK